MQPIIKKKYAKPKPRKTPLLLFIFLITWYPKGMLINPRPNISNINISKTNISNLGFIFCSIT